MKYRKILIMGMSGAGKTTLAEKLTRQLHAMWYNADSVRNQIYPDLGYSADDRVTQAARMGHLCDFANNCGMVAIADFICPTPECRSVFGADYTIFVDRPGTNQYEDTNKLFIKPENPNITLTTGTSDDWLQMVIDDLGIWSDKKPTALLISRSQMFSAEHREAVHAAVSRVGQCCIAICSTGDRSSDAYLYNKTKEQIETECLDIIDNIKVINIPNITDVSVIAPPECATEIN